jgi:ferrous iron transport protein A
LLSIIKINLKTLADLKIGEKGIIKGFSDATMALKLLEMGCLPETEITVDFTAPLGCPVCISVGDYQLSLRRTEAATVIIRTMTE